MTARTHALTIGARVKLPSTTHYRTLYPIYERNVLLCFAGIKNGWGSPWEIYPLLAQRGTHGFDFEGMVPDPRNAIRFYSGGREGAVERLTDPVFREKYADVLHNREEVLHREAQRRLQAKKSFADALASSIKLCAIKTQQRDALSAVLNDEQYKEVLSRPHRDALADMATAIEAEVKSLENQVAVDREKLAKYAEDMK